MTFTVYSKNNCPYCHKIKQVFDLTEQKYVVYNLDVDFTKDQFYAEFGEGSTFPQVSVENKNIGGCSDTIQFLREQEIL
jgi:glutaredoxin